MRTVKERLTKGVKSNVKRLFHTAGTGRRDSGAAASCVSGILCCVGATGY